MIEETDTADTLVSDQTKESKRRRKFRQKPAGANIDFANQVAAFDDVVQSKLTKRVAFAADTGVKLEPESYKLRVPSVSKEIEITADTERTVSPAAFAEAGLIFIGIEDARTKLLKRNKLLAITMQLSVAISICIAVTAAAFLIRMFWPI